MRKIKYISFFLLTVVLLTSCGDDNMDLYYPTDGLVSYFPFEGNLRDAHGDTPEGTKSEFGVIYETGRQGQAIKLDGNSGTVEFDRTDFSTGNSTSVSVWFKSNHTEFDVMLTSSDFVIIMQGTRFSLNLSTPTASANQFADYLENTWTHFVATFDGVDLKMYVNDALMVNFPFPYELGHDDRNLSISPYSNWGGSVDELFIYDKALTQEEVTLLFNR